MKEKSPSLVIITDALQADALTTPRSLRHLAPFIGREVSISQVAEETKAKANTVLARAKRLLALGLLKITRQEPRKGRAIKYYRAVAESFFVPYEVTSKDTLESMMQERDMYWENLLRRGVVKARIDDIGTWGTRIYKDDRGRLQIQTATTPEHNYTMLDDNRPAVMSAWRDGITLDFADAKTLQKELFDLLKRYGKKKGSQRYIIRLGMAPFSD